MAIRSKVSILGAIAGAGILATLLLGASPAAQRTAARDALQYFPYPDRRSFGAEGEALLAKAARERRADAPNVADAIQYLSQRERYAEALSLARDATRTQPARIREIARAMARLGVEVPFRDTHIALREPLAALIRDMRARLKELPREDAARAARAVLELEDPRRRNAGGLRAFATEYAGTEEAELAEVDLLPGALDPAGRLKALEAFARERPGTVAAAKALYMRGEETGHAFGQGAPDPTERFMSVVKVVAELESGKFPPCEWVDRAPDLVNYFLAPRAKYSPENVDRVLETYKQFMLKHLDSLTESLAGGPPSLLTHELPELFAVKGVANGVERLLDELERESADPDAVRLIRASYDFYSGGRPVDEAARNAGIERSRRALEEIGSHAGSRWRAPALAILASQQFERRNYAAAIVAYRGYLAANPDSASSWVAAIRVGQAQAESGDLAAARQSLRAAASTHGSRPVARFVALAFAAQASAGLGDFESELADLKQALTAWDPDYGSTFTFGLERPAYLGAAPSVLLRSLQREKLVSRVTTLPAALTRPNGKELEIARWRLERSDWEGAISILEKIPADGAALLRLARLERALALADVSSAAPDASRADRELQALAGPSDFTTTAAHLARAALAWKSGRPDVARQAMRSGLEAWRANQPTQSPAKGSLAADVMEIRDAVFLPIGGPVYRSGWNAFEFPATLPPYLLARTSVSVRFPDGRTEAIAVNRLPGGLPNTLFFNEEQEIFLLTLMARLGGTATKPPAQIMEVPNQPVGPSVQLLTLFNEFFPARPGHWAGWEFFTYPVISQIEFQDASRTRAVAAVIVGYSGADALLEKRNGVWVVTGLTNFWIT